ncbi:Hypothetical protein J6897_03887 [Nakaseomyces glabratus]
MGMGGMPNTGMNMMSQMQTGVQLGGTMPGTMQGRRRGGGSCNDCICCIELCGNCLTAWFAPSPMEVRQSATNNPIPNDRIAEANKPVPPPAYEPVLDNRTTVNHTHS